MVVEISALVSRNQRQKTQFNLSYGYGEISDNVQKCAECANMRAFWRVFAKSSVITQIKF